MFDGIEKTRFRHGARNMKFYSERSSISDMMQRKQGSEERGPQLSDSLKKGSRAHEMRCYDATDARRRASPATELKTHSFPRKSAATEQIWIVDRIRKQQSSRICCHVSRTGADCGIAGERAGLDTESPTNTHSQPCMPTARQCERC